MGCVDCGIGIIASGPNAGAKYLKGAASLQWTKPCDIGTGNGLKCDPVTGNAWVAPPMTVLGIDSLFGPHFTGNVVNGAISSTFSTTLANPSTCNDMEMFVGHNFGFGITFDGPFEVDVQYFASYAVNAPAPTPTGLASETIVGSTTGVARTVWSQHLDYDWFSPILVPAGQYLSVSHHLQVTALRYLAASPPVWHVNGSNSVIKIHGISRQA